MATPQTAAQESIEAERRQYAAAAAEWERERERHRQVVEALQQCIDDLRRRLVSAGQANSPLRITAGTPLSTALPHLLPSEAENWVKMTFSGIFCLE